MSQCHRDIQPSLRSQRFHDNPPHDHRLATPLSSELHLIRSAPVISAPRPPRLLAETIPPPTSTRLLRLLGSASIYPPGLRSVNGLPLQYIPTYLSNIGKTIYIYDELMTSARKDHNQLDPAPAPPSAPPNSGTSYQHILS